MKDRPSSLGVWEFVYLSIYIAALSILGTALENSKVESVLFPSLDLGSWTVRALKFSLMSVETLNF